MSDNKYGRIFTQADVEKIVEFVQASPPRPLHTTIALMEANGERFKFPEDEPVFVLRGRDKRARATVRYYADHQSAQAPFNHMNAVEGAYRSFDLFANDNPELIKEPD